MTDRNAAIVEEFRTHHGKVGGVFEGKPILLLTHTGAKSGRTRTNPLMYLEDGDRTVIFASKGGHPTHPHWYRNLVANPEVTVEIGDETFAATAVELTGEERDRIYAIQSERYPQFAEYQERADRRIPVIALLRTDS
jgi:deazaflavin-dependent oxidoreductase (nitroreductase family)